MPPRLHSLLALCALLSGLACRRGETSVPDPAAAAPPVASTADGRYWSTGGRPIAVLVDGIYAYVVHGGGPARGFVTRNGPDGEVVDTIVDGVLDLRGACFSGDRLCLADGNGIAYYPLESGGPIDVAAIAGTNGVCSGPAATVFASTAPSGQLWRSDIAGLENVVVSVLPKVTSVAYDERGDLLYATASGASDGVYVLSAGDPTPRPLPLPAADYTASVVHDGHLYLSRDSTSGSLGGVDVVRLSDATLVTSLAGGPTAGQVGVLGGGLLLVPQPQRRRVAIHRLGRPGD